MTTPPRGGQIVTLRLSESEANDLRYIMRAGHFQTKSDAIRAALVKVSQSFHAESIADQYARGYTAHPQAQDDLAWVGDVGLKSLSEPD